MPTGTNSMLFWKDYAELNGKKNIAQQWGSCPSSGAYMWGFLTGFVEMGDGHLTKKNAGGVARRG